jgi:hypothetical protein
MHLVAALGVPLAAVNIPWTATWSVPGLAGVALLGIGLNVGTAFLVRKSVADGA